MSPLQNKQILHVLRTLVPCPAIGSALVPVGSSPGGEAQLELVWLDGDARNLQQQR